MTTEMLAEKHTFAIKSGSSRVGNGTTLREVVETTLRDYLTQLDGAPMTDVYQMVLAEVEAPLMEEVMKYTRNNQTKASTLLGLNRGTLRKKLKQYGLL
jgi:Fis family transcriptional regulator